MSTFDELNIKENILRGVYTYGFEKPSVIQQKSIPLIIEGRDIISQAQSGTGKTGAFTIGSLCRVDPEINETQLLILLPTHELATQVYDFTKEISKYLEINIVKLIGGTPINSSFELLNTKPHVIIGSPGRILDLMNRRRLMTSALKNLVLDEADEMLSSGFNETIYNIVCQLPKTTQICLFSATLPREILELTDKFMNNPEKILVKNEELTLEGIQQYYVSVKHNDWKYDIITDLYDIINVNQCIIYINNKKKVLELYDKFISESFPVSYISGDRTSEERKEIMENFKSGDIRILLSTDLLSRGIDVQQLSLVINYDLPKEKETYIHRIGRSGRYGRKGVAINLLNDNDLNILNDIEKFYNTTINEMPANISELIN
jgi:superfamily II DNA/RNA helicase